MSSLKNLPKQGIVFWPVGTGDSNTICIDKDTTLQVDLHHMVKSEDEEDPHYAIVDELIKFLPKKDKKPYLSLFVLTHPDDDHIQGFEYMLKNVKIGEIWFTPKIFMEYDKDLCADAKKFKDEVDRRKKLAIEKSGDLESGNKLKIIGYDKILEEEEFEGFPDKLLLYPGKETNEVDGKSYEEVNIFIHAPFKDDMSGEKNETSVGMQIELYNGENIGSILLFGDLDYPILKKIFDLSLNRSNKEKLRWDILLAPHHCSKSIMYYKDEGDEEEKFKKDIMESFESNKGVLGYIVSSSEPIPSSNKSGDNPPHAKAKNRYEEIVDNGKFLCTQEHPNENKTEPIVFSFGDNGFNYEKPDGDDDSGKSSILMAIKSARGEKTAPTKSTDFGNE